MPSHLSEFRGFCNNASDAQLPNIYYKEQTAGRDAEAEIALAVAEGRGIDVHDTPNEYIDGVHREDRC